ncbi:MotA/TolQ/ExbB proton channel family protein [Flavobacteriales bacterium]|jgi:biopolymer transport protein ExbB|nr:MotA/TolQ/ExbB proton channel family protein [Flavobacteriales bacterium]
MKKLLSLLAIFGLLNINNLDALAQDETSSNTEITTDSSAVDSLTTDTVAEAAAPAPVEEISEEVPEAGFHQVLKEKFIEGGAGFMGIVLIALILGLALCIERIIYLNLATTNTDQLLGDIDEALNKGGVEDAKEICRNTPGPVASIFYQGLERSSEGLDMVEKSIVAYGSVQMGRLERNTSWISLFIALAPMLGFMGTVIGMIGAFDAIEANNNISPALVAGGIKVALLTTVFGLIVAMILQVFYNYIIAKIDNLVNSMEDASITLIDILARQEAAKK